MNILNYPKDTFEKFLMLILLNHVNQINGDYDELKELVDIKIDYSFSKVKFRGYEHNGAKIIFNNPYINRKSKPISILIAYVPETCISRLMFNLGCKGLIEHFALIRTKLLKLAPSKHSSVFNTGTGKLMRITAPLMRDMANGRLVFRTWYIPIGS